MHLPYNVQHVVRRVSIVYVGVEARVLVAFPLLASTVHVGSVHSPLGQVPEHLGLVAKLDQPESKRVAHCCQHRYKASRFIWSAARSVLAKHSQLTLLDLFEGSRRLFLLLLQLVQSRLGNRVEHSRQLNKESNLLVLTVRTKSHTCSGVSWSPVESALVAYRISSPVRSDMPRM